MNNLQYNDLSLPKTMIKTLKVVKKMKGSRNLIVFLIFITRLQFPTTRSATQSDYSCGVYVDSFLPGSAYDTNLRLLLNYLVTHTKATFGEDIINYAVGVPPDKVYGEAICVTTDNIKCSACLNNAKSDLLLVCANKKAAQDSTDSYGNCLLSYDPTNRYGTNLTPPPPPMTPPTAPAEFDSPPPPPMTPPITPPTAPPEFDSPPPPPMTPPMTPPTAPAEFDSPPPPETSKGDLPQPPPPPPHLPQPPPSPRKKVPKRNPPTPRVETPPPQKEGTRLVLFVVLPTGFVAFLVISFLLFLLFRRKRTEIQVAHQQRQPRQSDYHFNVDVKPSGQEAIVDPEIRSTQACRFRFSTLDKATNNFSAQNLLGQGGCGPVYKGILDDGQEIAVKRVLVKSKEGRKQLENEIVLVSKLQHKNLANILGFCFEEDDALVVYEYLPNTSLDKILHDPIRAKQLDWPTRFKIINGVARGLLYLHEDSRVKIIHRDMKPGNVLLDTNMNPRISDFGIAKNFEGDQTCAETRHVIGTLEYMAPEYRLYGEYSMKSDAYSFGVLMLEIITGKRKPSSSGSKELIDKVSRNFLEGTITEVLDPVILGGSYVEEEVLRCINAALHCVRDEPSDRPEMSSLVVMLSSPMGMTPLMSTTSTSLSGSSISAFK